MKLYLALLLVILNLLSIGVFFLVRHDSKHYLTSQKKILGKTNETFEKKDNPKFLLGSYGTFVCILMAFSLALYFILNQ